MFLNVLKVQLPKGSRNFNPYTNFRQTFGSVLNHASQDLYDFIFYIFDLDLVLSFREIKGEYGEGIGYWIRK